MRDVNNKGQPHLERTSCCHDGCVRIILCFDLLSFMQNVEVINVYIHENILH